MAISQGRIRAGFISLSPLSWGVWENSECICCFPKLIIFSFISSSRCQRTERSVDVFSFRSYRSSAFLSCPLISQDQIWSLFYVMNRSWWRPICVLRIADSPHAYCPSNNIPERVWCSFPVLVVDSMSRHSNKFLFFVTKPFRDEKNIDEEGSK